MISTIVPLAVIVTSLWLAAALFLLRRKAGGFFPYVWFILAGALLPVVVNLYLKAPFIRWLAQAGGVPPGQGLAGTPLWFLIALWLVSPVFEEAIKSAPGVFPPGSRLLDTPRHALWMGLSLGFGFGLGEVWYITWSVAASGLTIGLPWTAFTGFALERALVVPCHAMMTAIAVLGFQRRGGWAVWGYLIAVGLHALINAGAFLAQLGQVSMLAAEWIVVGGLGLMAFLLARIYRRSPRPANPAGENQP